METEGTQKRIVFTWPEISPTKSDAADRRQNSQRCFKSKDSSHVGWEQGLSKHANSGRVSSTGLFSQKGSHVRILTSLQVQKSSSAPLERMWLQRQPKFRDSSTHQRRVSWCSALRHTRPWLPPPFPYTPVSTNRIPTPFFSSPSTMVPGLQSRKFLGQPPPWLRQLCRAPKCRRAVRFVPACRRTLQEQGGARGHRSGHLAFPFLVVQDA